MYAYRELDAHRKLDKKLEDKHCKDTKKVCSREKPLNILWLMTIRLACLGVKQYTESKRCLKIRNTWGTQ